MHLCYRSSKHYAETMSLRALKKLFTGNVIKVVLLINLLCFLSLTLQGLFTWNTFHSYQSRHDTSFLYLKNKLTFSTVRPWNATINYLALKKIEQMKRELNDSVLLNNFMFPARRIGRYLLLDPNLCKSVDPIDIVIIVHTAPANLQKRQRIRDSFAKSSLFRPFDVRVAFLLGKTANKTLERILWMEHARYNDTVMGDFDDHYHNLSLKGVMGFRWVSQYCSNSGFVLKIDDDILVNMFKLLYSFLNHMSGKKKSIFCNLWHSGSMPILRQGKWKVEPHVFSSRTTFPYDYCSGFLVLMTSDLMKPMYEASLTTPFFWIDDIYLFGMLPLVVGDITYYNYALDQNLTLNDKVAVNCTRDQGPRCPIFATYISEGNYWPYWNTIKDLYTSNNWKLEQKIIH